MKLRDVRADARKILILFNAYGQPVGAPVEHWTPRPLPLRTALVGRVCRVEPVDVERHVDDLFAAHRAAPDDRDWTYLPFERPTDRPGYAAFLAGMAATSDPLHFAVIDAVTEKAVGTAAYMRIDPANGVIEIGWIRWSPLLQRHTAGTEAVYLMMRRAFDELGYRRIEWKCDSLNERSRAAALRFGFTFEGTFRNAAVVKDHNRDTSWFSITEEEWPFVKASFELWLAPSNFDEEGRQLNKLAAVREAL